MSATQFADRYLFEGNSGGTV